VHRLTASTSPFWRGVRVTTHVSTIRPSGVVIMRTVFTFTGEVKPLGSNPSDRGSASVH
jgi:hypothetical protein